MTRRRMLLLASATVFACVQASWCPAQDQILGADMSRRVFYAQCQGAVNSSPRFTGLRMQIIVSHAPPSSLNPLQIIIESIPALAQRNAFYWDSEQTSMEVTSSSVRCRYIAPGARSSGLHFYYMSPALYKSNLMATHQESERIRWINTYAKPIRIAALDAELTLNFQANSVTGTIRMNGQDDMARRPAQYVATLQGQEYVYERPKQ